jgi:hypothetical protein
LPLAKGGVLMPSAQELNARPWGEQTGQQGVKSAAQLNEQEYETNPFAIGLLASDYAEMHLEHGEAFRYWEATPLADATAESNEDGNLYHEVELGGNGHGRFYSTKREITTKDFGVLPIGSTMFGCLPSVVEVTPGSRILRVAQAWRRSFTVRRGSTDVDTLPERFIVSIESVTFEDGSVAGPADYEPVSANSPNDNDKGGIRWLASAPIAGTPYTVKCRFYPLFACLGEMVQGEPLGADGERLPQRILLKKERE